MGNILNMDVGSLFNKKEDEQKTTSLDVESEQIIKAAPVETMFYDLNPDKKPAITPNQFSTETAKQGNSPLNSAPGAPNQNPFAAGVNGGLTRGTQPNISNQPNIPLPPNPQAATPLSNTITPGSVQIKKSSTGKIIGIIISILIVLTLAGGLYYFLVLSKDSELVELESPTEITLPEESTPTPIQPPVPETPKPKYMTFDFQTSSAAQIIATLKKYTADAKASGETKALEYLAVDLQNAPITFSAFSQKIGITLSPEITATLNDSFSIFVYNENALAGIGLAIEIKDEATLKTALLASEKDLVSALNPIILDRPAGEIDKNTIVFGSGTYKEVPVKFYNLPNANGLSIDYAVISNKLIFGTTRFTFESIIDSIKSQSTPQ